MSKSVYNFTLYLQNNNLILFNMEITIASNYLLFGLSWFSPDDEFDYSELNIYILCIHIQFQF